MFIILFYLFFSCFISFFNNDFIVVFYVFVFVWFWGFEVFDFSGDLFYFLFIVFFDCDCVFFYYYFNFCWNGVFYWVVKI